MYNSPYPNWYPNNPFEPRPIRAILMTREGFIKVEDFKEFKHAFKIPMCAELPPFNDEDFISKPITFTCMEFVFDSWYPGEEGRTGVYKQV